MDEFRPILFFDGECGFCRWAVEALRVRTRGAVRFLAWQEEGGKYPEITQKAFESAVQWIEVGRDGEGHPVLTGADAIFRVLEFAPWPWQRLGAWARFLPGGMAVSRWAYRQVARHRGWLSRWLCRCG